MKSVNALSSRILGEYCRLEWGIRLLCSAEWEKNRGNVVQVTAI